MTNAQRLRLWRAAHREHYNAQARGYDRKRRAERPESEAAKCRIYRERHPDLPARRRARYAARRKAGWIPPWTLKTSVPKKRVQRVAVPDWTAKDASKVWRKR